MATGIDEEKRRRVKAGIATNLGREAESITDDIPVKDLGDIDLGTIFAIHANTSALVPRVQTSTLEEVFESSGI